MSLKPISWWRHHRWLRRVAAARAWQQAARAAAAQNDVLIRSIVDGTR